LPSSVPQPGRHSDNGTFLIPSNIVDSVIKPVTLE